MAIYYRSTKYNTNNWRLWIRKKNKKLIKKLESVDLKHYNDPKIFNEYLNDMQKFHKNIDEYNPSKILKLLIAFHDMVADMISNKSVIE